MDALLANAESLESRYRWTDAAEVLEAALAHASEDQLRVHRAVRERLAYARYRAAFQSDSPPEFRDRMQKAQGAYEAARDAYASLDAWGRPRSLRCEAMMAWARFWLAPKVSEKARIVAEEWNPAVTRALREFERAEEPLEFGRTLNQIFDHPIRITAVRYALDQEVRQRVRDGEHAVRCLLGTRDPNELARAYAHAAGFLFGYSLSAEKPAERQESQRLAIDHWRKALAASVEAAHLALREPLTGDGSDESVTTSMRAAELATATGDRYLAGWTSNVLGYQLAWRSYAVVDPAEQAELLERALQNAIEAQRQFDTLGVPGRAEGEFASESARSRYYYHLAELEANLPKKGALLEKALIAARAELLRAQDLSFDLLEMGVRGSLCQILKTKARIEARPERKRELLQEALVHAQESLRLHIGGSLIRWNLGEAYGDFAEVVSELAALTEDPEMRENALRDAFSAMEKGLSLLTQEQGFYELRGETAGYLVIGDRQYQAGNLLRRLWEATRDPGHLRSAVDMFGRSAVSYGKLDLRSRMAECQWRTAELYDALGNHRKAAHHFRLASETYEAAAGKVPRLQELCKDHGLYMSAWGEIEGARHHHARQEYEKARELYESSARLLRFTRRWSAFAPNFSAWAAVERAEAMSRKERPNEAIQAFRDATRLFEEARTSLAAAMPSLDDQDRRTMAEGLEAATDARSRYCHARILLEEARILERRGEHLASSEGYGDAADRFEEIACLLPEGGDRDEIRLIMTFSRAWQAMTRGEANASAEEYEEAARLFDEAKDLSSTEPGRTLAIAHGHFCAALAEGSAFSETHEANRHAAAVRHLEAAAKQYEKLGLSGPSHFAKASRLLFDAYLYKNRADQEGDPEIKAKLYGLSERVLRASANAFARAGQRRRGAEVQKLVAEVKREQQLAISLGELLRAPVVASTTRAFPTPTPTHEKPVGLDRFERADIQASLILRERAVELGHAFDLEIEMVNAGRGTAQLVKVEELGLDKFDLAHIPEPYGLDERNLDMKGKRLDPLKTAEVRLVLVPLEPGTFHLRPRILYLSDPGGYRFHEPDAVEIVVTARSA